MSVGRPLGSRSCKDPTSVLWGLVFLVLLRHDFLVEVSESREQILNCCHNPLVDSALQGIGCTLFTLSYQVRHKLVELRFIFKPMEQSLEHLPDFNVLSWQVIGDAVKQSLHSCEHVWCGQLTLDCLLGQAPQ